MAERGSGSTRDPLEARGAGGGGAVFFSFGFLGVSRVFSGFLGFSSGFLKILN